jgi:hypothetical protein
MERQKVQKENLNKRREHVLEIAYSRDYITKRGSKKWSVCRM